MTGSASCSHEVRVYRPTAQRTISWSGDISANWETTPQADPGRAELQHVGDAHWTTDIGGFFRRGQYTSDAYHELLIRWFQFGAFSPIFRVTATNRKPKCGSTAPVEGILKEFDELRYPLALHVLNCFGVTNRGATMMKALPFVSIQVISP